MCLKIILTAYVHEVKFNYCSLQLKYNNRRDPENLFWQSAQHRSEYTDLRY
jgi:hypothetical protein